MEVTILPAGGYNRGGDILYVDCFDGGGVQNYYDGAFMVLGIDDLVDRFDVRGPTSGVSNRLGGRVYNVQNQLNDVYNKIIWDSGPSSITLGDGSGDPEKTDDYLLVNTFLANGWAGNPGGSNGGVFLLGDRQAEYLAAYAGASAVSFRSTYLPFTLINDNHRLAPSLFAISPSIKFWPGRAYLDNFNLFGGCAALNDFDVIGASGATLVQMSYNTASNANGAVVSKQTAVTGGTATAIMAGFSMAYVRDDELDGISDRAEFINRSLLLMGNDLGPTTGAGDSPAKNELSQNYPNPFNPQTTIAFQIKDRERDPCGWYVLTHVGRPQRCRSAGVERCLLLQARDEQLLADEEDGSSEVRSLRTEFVVPTGAASQDAAPVSFAPRKATPCYCRNPDGICGAAADTSQ
jgi:hypothetical protein